MEYTQDRLRKQIKDLEEEVSYLNKKLHSYRDYEKNRVVLEVMLIIIGATVGCFLGILYVR